MSQNLAYSVKQGFLVIVSLVAPYLEIEGLKVEQKFVICYIRLKIEVENIFLKTIKSLNLTFSVDTTNKDIRLTANEILSIYW